MKLIILPPVPTTTSILAPDPVPPDNARPLYGAGSSVNTEGGDDWLYPVPPATTLNPVTVPAVPIIAVTAAPTPEPPIVAATETFGGNM